MFKYKLFADEIPYLSHVKCKMEISNDDRLTLWQKQALIDRRKTVFVPWERKSRSKSVLPIISINVNVPIFKTLGRICVQCGDLNLIPES